MISFYTFCGAQATGCPARDTVRHGAQMTMPPACAYSVDLDRARKVVEVRLTGMPAAIRVLILVTFLSRQLRILRSKSVFNREESSTHPVSRLLTQVGYLCSEGRHMMEIAIRSAQPEDATEIVKLISEHASAAGESTTLTSEYVGEYLCSPSSRILLAVTEGRIAGLLSWSLRPDLYHAGNTCLIQELIVTEQARDQGIGGALMAGLFARLMDCNCVEVSVAVMPDNLRTQKFYRSHGLSDEALLLEKHISRSTYGVHTSELDKAWDADNSS